MLEPWRERLHIAVGASAISLVVARGGWRPSVKVLARQAWDLHSRGGDVLPKVLNDLLVEAAPRQRSARVLLSDALVRTWLAEPPRNATRVQDCEAAAAMRFQAIFDESPQDWVLRSSPDASRPFLACALRRSLFDGLRQVLRARQLCLVSMEPELIALWNHWRRRLPPNAWFGICGEDSLVLGVVQGARLTSLRRQLLSASVQQDRGCLSQLLRREADRLNLAAPAGIALCGQPPPAWLANEEGAPVVTLLGPQCDALSLLGVTL